MASHLTVPKTAAQVNSIQPGQTDLFEEERAFPRLHWNYTDTDLLELVTALYEMKAVKSASGKLTKRQLQLALEWLFNHPIKGAGAKLTKARDRKVDPAKFLHALKQAFLDYANRN